MQDRLKRILEEKDLTATKFAAIIKVNASAMSHILNGRSKPGFDVLDKIGQAFPDINLNWLISGKGEMYQTQSSGKVHPIQKSLFEEEERNNRKDAFVQVEKTEQPPVVTSPAPEVTAAIMQAPAHKTIKRIILFFSDGSFEDYSKEN